MKNILFLCVLFIVFASCSSSDDTSPLPEAEESFFGLVTGIGWVYWYYQRVDNTEEFEYTGAQTQAAIYSTTTINGQEYFELETTTILGDQPCSVCPEEGIVYTHLRDSMGYLVNANGTILYSSKEVGQEYLIHEMEAFNIYGKLLPGEEIVATGYDTFSCLINEVYAKSNSDGTVLPGRDYIYYSENEGEILRKYSTANSTQHQWEKRLEAVFYMDR